MTVPRAITELLAPSVRNCEGLWRTSKPKSGNPPKGWRVTVELANALGLPATEGDATREVPNGRDLR